MYSELSATSGYNHFSQQFLRDPWRIIGYGSGWRKDCRKQCSQFGWTCLYHSGYQSAFKGDISDVRFLNNAGMFYLLKRFLLLGDFVWFRYVGGHFFDGLREFSPARFREHAHTERK